MTNLRSISEILIEADNAQEPGEISAAWEEIAKNKKQYSLVELQFAHERLCELARKMINKPINYGTNS